MYISVLGISLWLLEGVILTCYAPGSHSYTSESCSSPRLSADCLEPPQCSVRVSSYQPTLEHLACVLCLTPHSPASVSALKGLPGLGGSLLWALVSPWASFWRGPDQGVKVITTWVCLPLPDFLRQAHTLGLFCVQLRAWHKGGVPGRFVDCVREQCLSLSASHRRGNLGVRERQISHLRSNPSSPSGLWGP